MEITVISNTSNFDLATFSWGVSHIGELDIYSVADMVAKVSELCKSEQAVISRLNIIGHGNEDEIEIGSDVLSLSNICEFESSLRKLRYKFDTRGIVHLQHCDIGKNQLFIKSMARIFDVPVFAGTGKHIPNYRFNLGDYVVCNPDGSCMQKVGRPQTPYE